uniref:BTB domain-containing protein n=1 Tax=Panagrolaimus superbus TaxID=310955 RepID=A0A914Z2B9_9BILA
MLEVPFALGNAKKIEADYNVTIDSANYYQNFYHVYDKSNGRGNFTCSAEEFFDPNYKIFVNGKFTIKVDGNFKIDAPASVFSEQKWNGGRLGDELWLKDDTKDFVIVVENRYIKVHKFILINRSEVFAAMFKSNTKEFIENKVEIIDFPFDVVEAGILLIYDCNCITTLSFNYQMSLLQFFDKYNLPMHKAETEAFLISQVSTSTVCRLTNCSIFTNSLKLKEKCMEFLMGCFATKTPLCDINILDADIALEMLQNYRYHVAKTE